jgi:cytochrome c oxidase cbb3-type subunit 3/ubiquinol-cytochrome c reductase cytochrome c subunit
MDYTVGPEPMRLRPVLECVAVVAACVASGTLECGGVQLGEPERRGQATYDRMCAVCHGLHGEGYAADQAPMLANRRFLASASDDFLRGAIDNGRGGTTMSAWGRLRGGPLVRGDTNNVIAFLRSWQSDPRADLDERPPAGDAKRGEAIFARECASCHGATGTGGPNVSLGTRDFLQAAGNGYLRYAIRGGRPGTPMPAFDKKLGDAGVEDVLALLRTWQSQLATKPMPPPPKPPPIPLGPVPLNPGGPDPVGFNLSPGTTKIEVIKGQLDRGARMAILDARAPSDYLNEHIAGAVSVPFYDPEPYFAELPKSSWIVCYCACPHAESGQLAKKLRDHGFPKVTVLDEGLGVWRSRKYPVHAGVDP